MSYLHSPRLVFSGDFWSDVSTVNNDPAHYNNDTFVSSFQEFGQGGTNGWWNPEGGANFRFQQCTIRQLVLDNGQVITDPAADWIVGVAVAGPGDRNTGKMVDLDPQMQGCSALWGVKLRIVTANQEVVLEGDMDTTAFRDLQQRQSAGIQVNGQPMGGTWTSVLENVVYGPAAATSPFLQALKARSAAGKLSVNLNAYGYYYAHAADGRFSLGRVLGSIGPWFAGEPITFAACRRLYGVDNQGTDDNPATFFSNANFLFEKDKKRVTVDLGGCFPISDAMGTINISNSLFLAISSDKINPPPSTTPYIVLKKNLVSLTAVNYKPGPDWLNQTGGIVTMSNLPDDSVTLLADHQLVLVKINKDGQYAVLARESVDGTLVRADNFVCRLNANQTSTINFYAYAWGNPLTGATISLSLEPPTPSTPDPICTIPGNNFPASALNYNPAIKTNPKGTALLTIKGGILDNPRGYIDGQIYTMDYQLNGLPPDPAFGPYSNDNIFIHLYDYFPVPASPTWSDIAETMTQFCNVYPIMSKYLVDLSDPNAVIEKAAILQMAFTRDITDPIYMPVTRDLSEGKLYTIVKWLGNPIIAEPAPPKGTTPPHKSPSRTPKESPAPAGQPLTDKQRQLKNAVRAKNGSGFSFKEIKDLYKDGKIQ